MRNEWVNACQTEGVYSVNVHYLVPAFYLPLKLQLSSRIWASFVHTKLKLSYLVLEQRQTRAKSHFLSTACVFAGTGLKAQCQWILGASPLGALGGHRGNKREEMRAASSKGPSGQSLLLRPACSHPVLRPRSPEKDIQGKPHSFGHRSRISFLLAFLTLWLYPVPLIAVGYPQTWICFRTWTFVSRTLVSLPDWREFLIWMPSLQFESHSLPRRSSLDPESWKTDQTFGWWDQQALTWIIVPTALVEWTSGAIFQIPALTLTTWLRPGQHLFSLCLSFPHLWNGGMSDSHFTEWQRGLNEYTDTHVIYMHANNNPFKYM